MGLSENAMCKKCKQEQETSYHILCPCLALAIHRAEIIDSAWIQLTDIRRASIRIVLALEIFVRALSRSVHNEPSRGLNAWGN
jgi:hypothetical protein